MTFAANLEDALVRLMSRSRELGVGPETLIFYAIGDYRALGAMRRKAASLDDQIDRINRYLDRPPDK